MENKFQKIDNKLFDSSSLKSDCMNMIGGKANPFPSITGSITYDNGSSDADADTD